MRRVSESMVVGVRRVAAKVGSRGERGYVLRRWFRARGAPSEEARNPKSS